MDVPGQQLYLPTCALLIVNPLTALSCLALDVLLSSARRIMERGHRLRRQNAIFVYLPLKKRTVEICLGLGAAALGLEIYCLRELLVMEAIFVLGFAILALIGGVMTLVYIGILWSGKLVQRGKLVLRLAAKDTGSHGHKIPITALFEKKEEVS